MSASKTQDPGAHDGRAESDASRGGSAALATMGFVVALAVGFFAMRAYRTDSAAAAEAMDPGPRQWVERRGDEPQVGPDDAIVTIVEFTDYECAYCARAHAPLEAVMREYEGDVRWVIKHMPMPRHQAAVSAARM